VTGLPAADAAWWEYVVESALLPANPHLDRSVSRLLRSLQDLGRSVSQVLDSL